MGLSIEWGLLGIPSQTRKSTIGTVQSNETQPLDTVPIGKIVNWDGNTI